MPRRNGNVIPNLTLQLLHLLAGVRRKNLILTQFLKVQKAFLLMQ
nr:MAG TPA: hypothetical protein [Caudoviricetes sp.]